MEPIFLQIDTSSRLILTSLAIVTSGANRLFGALYPIICPQNTHTQAYIPTGVERSDVNHNRRRGVVSDDDGDGQVGRSQSA